MDFFSYPAYRGFFLALRKLAYLVPSFTTRKFGATFCWMKSLPLLLWRLPLFLYVITDQGNL
jgi:hypothetical protein